MSIKYIGLDFETSGTDPWGDSVPIQIGIATEDDKTFVANIGRWDWNTYTWSYTSQSIHGITRETLAAARPVWEVDILAAAWMLETVSGSRMFTIPVGWNVAGFDRQYITRWMPNLNRILSYRTVDLNAVVFAQATNEQHYKSLKDKSKAYAAEQIEGETAWHDALYDARAALHSFNYLRRKEASAKAKGNDTYNIV